MSKSRFYERAVSSLDKEGKLELVEDINGYVNNLLFERALLASELSLANTFNGNLLLKELGYSVNSIEKKPNAD